VTVPGPLVTLKETKPPGGRLGSSVTVKIGVQPPGVGVGVGVGAGVGVGVGVGVGAGVGVGVGVGFPCGLGPWI
jgi:hypothetical protein